VAKRSTGRVFASSALKLNTNSPSAITAGAIKLNVKIVKELPATGTQMFQKWMIGAFAMLAGGSTVSVFARRRRRTI
jgi:LPXTG-motif cell wall-anchored protein